MRKSEGHIAAALREHSRGKVQGIGKPRVGIGRWMAILVGAATTCTLVMGSGGIIHGTADMPSPASGKADVVRVGQRIAQAMPLAPPPLNGPLMSRDVEKQGVVVPYMSREFFDVAADAIRHNAGVSIDRARDMLDGMEDAGQHCARLAAATTGKRCVFESHGVMLDYGKAEFTATYQRYSKDGRVDLGDRRVGAVQHGDTVEVTADPRHRSFPVPSQGGP